jgi:hypothetical protein
MQIKLLFVFLIVAVFFTFTVGFADAETNIIEFKKKHVTNSPKVCGDKLCDEEQQSKSVPIRKNLYTPLGQYKLGIPIYQITCQEHLVFVLKISNWHPACVTPENVQRLVDRGWAVPFEDKDKILSILTEKRESMFKPLEEYRKEYPVYEGFGLSITPDIISGESYLIFTGYGWHGFHNVEITISNNSYEVEFIMTQTDDRGGLHMPWKIPQTVSTGWYHVYATDGIHEYEIDIPITNSEK